MYIRKRGQFYHYEFFVNGNRYAGSFNGKNGAKTAANKKEATEFAYQERRKVLDGTFRDEMEREELKDFVTFVDKVYLPFAREHHSSSTHDEFRCEVMKKYFRAKRFDEITMMLVVKFINERLNSDTVRREVLDNGDAVNKKRSPTTVNKEVTLLSSFSEWLLKRKLPQPIRVRNCQSPCGPKYLPVGSGIVVSRWWRRRRSLILDSSVDANTCGPSPR